MRRQPASLVPLKTLVLPQVFLGAESQLLAFSAAFPDLSDRMVFAALPEMFSGKAGISSWFPPLGAPAHPVEQLLHLRFGPIREARVLKFARNAAVIAEARTAPPLTPGYHPFASARVLPAAMDSLLLFAGASARPVALGRAPVAPMLLPPGSETADLSALNRRKTREQYTDGSGSGLDLVSLAQFRSWDWAVRFIPPEESLLTTLRRRPAVLLPWNMTHYGSILPELLSRVLKLRQPASCLPGCILLPYNYLGQTGMIRDLISTLREAADGDANALEHICLARVTTLAGLVVLRSLAETAWVDTTDPEAWWNVARLRAARFQPIELGATETFKGTRPCERFPAEDTLRVLADTRFGPLSFKSRLPTWRSLPALLDTLRPQERSAPARRRIRGRAP